MGVESEATRTRLRFPYSTNLVRGDRMPKLRIGTLVDRYDIADLNVKLVEAELSAVKKKRDICADALVNGFAKEFLKGATGTKRGAKLSLVTLTSPTIKDRSKLDAYIRKHRATDLLQGRVHKQAWLDRMEASGKPIPGVESYERVSLRLNRTR